MKMTTIYSLWRVLVIVMRLLSTEKDESVKVYVIYMLFHTDMVTFVFKT